MATLSEGLLPELTLLVIEQLAGQVHPDAYLFPDDVRDVLRNLTFVSRTTRAFALPFLFQRVVIRSSAHLERFYRLHVIPNSNSTLLNHVEALAIIGFDEITVNDAQYLSELFMTISTSLERLTIDLPLRNYSPEDDREEVLIRTPLRKAMTHFTRLAEFVSIRDELYLKAEDEPRYTIWTDWKSLRRLALYNPDIFPPFHLALTSLPHLHTLAIARYDDDDALYPLIKNSSGLKDVLLLDPSRWNLISVRPVFQERRDIRFRLYLPREQVEDEIARTQQWYLTQVLEGSLWEYEGDLLD